MSIVSLLASKAILSICNFLLLICGILLITSGLFILFDNDKILLSRLLTTNPLATSSQPLFFYIAIGLASVGLFITFSGILGCWASCMQNYAILSIYFFLIMIVLFGECAIYATSWAWPTCLGLDVDTESLVKDLQRNYGTDGQEQFTAAFDLAQTMFNCCGVESANEFDTSLWRLQALGPTLSIPLSCCKLENYNENKAYLNPQPHNLTLCQALESNRHHGYRHLEGCSSYLQQWYRQHFLILLGLGLLAVLIEFIVILSIVLMCTRIYKHNQENSKIVADNHDSLEHRSSASQTFQRTPNAYTNETYGASSSFRQNYKLVDKV